MIDYKSKIDAAVENNEFDKGNVVILHRDPLKVITLSEHSSKGKRFGTLRIFYNNSKAVKRDFEREITEESILQDLPQDIFKDISNIVIGLSTTLPEIDEDSILDVKCEKVYPHSQKGVAMFKTDVKLPTA